MGRADCNCRSRPRLGQQGSLANAQDAIYALPSSDFHDITSGSNGFSASSGYDLASGRGSPIANLVVSGLVTYSGSTSFTVSSPTTTTRSGGFSGGGAGVDFSLPTHRRRRQPSQQSDSTSGAGDTNSAIGLDTPALTGNVTASGTSSDALPVQLAQLNDAALQQMTSDNSSTDGDLQFCERCLRHHRRPRGHRFLLRPVGSQRLPRTSQSGLTPALAEFTAPSQNHPIFSSRRPSRRLFLRFLVAPITPGASICYTGRKHAREAHQERRLSSPPPDVSKLLAEHGRQLHALLFRLTLRTDVAEDLLQDLFCKLTDSDGISQSW